MQKQCKETFILYSQKNWLPDHVFEIETTATFFKRTA